MGQRLNLEIIKGDGDHVLANSYYHWSAYSSSSMALAAEIIAVMASEEFASKTFKSDIDLAVRLLESTGAGVRKGIEEEEQAFKDLGLNIDEYKECVDRNEGLIAVSTTGIENTRSYEEGRVQIDIENKCVKFYVISVETPADWLEWNSDESSYLDLPVNSDWDLETMEFTFEEFIKFVTFSQILITKGCYSYYDIKRNLVVSYTE